jgi:hypothetical protein
MNKKNILKILSGIVVIALLIKLFTLVLAEPWVKKKLIAKVNENIRDYTFGIEKVRISLIRSGIELDSITIFSKKENGAGPILHGKIAFIKVRGIRIAKAIFKKDLSIRELIISKSSFKGKIPFPGKAMPPVIVPWNIRIGSLLFNETELNVGSTTTAQSFKVVEGNFKIRELGVEKHDTLSPDAVKQFDFEAKELSSVSADSMYSYNGMGIICSADANTLTADKFSIQPNYKDYDFTSRYEFQTNRFDAGFSNIFIHGFKASDFFRSGNLISSYIEIGKMDLKVFRDKRKEFRHVKKPAFQDMIYKYPKQIRIDSIGLLSGNIVFTVHADKANEPGHISFNKISAVIYKITNDSIYKTKSGYLELRSNALLMGKGRIDVFLKGRIFDNNNTFSLSGTLSDMDADDLNPILEKNAFLYATSGKIDKMSFSFTANNNKATGKMTMLYHGLDITIKNKHTDDTTAFREKLISFFANEKIINSNPMPGKEVREGTINNERDPERFLFNYCFKSILSGIKSSLLKSPKNRNNQ